MLTLTFLKNHPLITPVPVPVLFKSHVLATSQKTPCFVVSRVVTSSRNTWRSFEFWRRVLTIWATFKFTQCSITAQSAFQSPDWPRQQWNRQHHRAADVSSLHLTKFSSIDFHISLLALTGTFLTV